MKFAWIAVAVLLVQSAAASQVATGTIEGRVVRRDNGEPLAKVTVTLGAGQGNLLMVTGADGRFVFQNLPPGPYFLSAQRVGYTPVEYRANTSDNIVLQAGQRLAGIQLRMNPTGAVSGRILDRSGEALSGVEVLAQRLSYPGGVPRLSGVQRTSTNDLGEYRLFWLSPGSYYISAFHEPDRRLPSVLDFGAGPQFVGTVSLVHEAQMPSSGPSPSNVITSRVVDGRLIEETPVRTYYPGTANVDAAQRVEVKSGADVLGVDIVVVPARSFHIRGTVINAVSGLPVQVQTVTLSPRSAIAQETVPETTTTISGAAFQISGVVPGSYFLSARARDGDAALVGHQLVVDVGNSDLDNITIAAYPPLSISGRFTLEGTAADAAAVSRGGRAGQVLLRNSSSPGLREIAATITPDGNFTIVSPFRGVADIYVRNPAGIVGYVKSIRWGTDDGLLGPLHLDTPSLSPLEVVVSANAGTLQGLVTNEADQPVSNVTVVLVPDTRFRRRIDYFATTMTDSEGGFKLQGIAPGTYKAFAWDGIEEGAWHDPEFMRTQEPLGKPLSFVEGTSETVDLRLIRSP